MNVDSYDKLQFALLSGRVDECGAFLASRHESDKGSAEYWYWLAQMYYRSGRFQDALDVGSKLTREAGVFAMHFHFMADVCAHLGVTDIGLSALDTLASKPELAAASSYYVRLCGYHYLGEDDAVLSVRRDAVTPLSPGSEQYRARSVMRSQGIATGVGAFCSTYCSRQAVADFSPTLNVERYWCGQRELPKRLSIEGHSSGFGDFIQWARYAQALQALGVEISWAAGLNGILGDYKLNDHSHQLAQQLVAAGFVCGRNDTSMWSDPFALFASLFPVLNYGSTDRYIAQRTDNQVEQTLNDIRQRAQGRRCVGIFWSSCESNNLYASRSLLHQHLAPVWDASDDIHWVIMQRGYQRACWLDGSYSKDPQRCTILPAHISLAQTIGIIDCLDGFVGNDGVLSHAAGALNKPGYLLLNARCADWRYEQSVGTTPWYPSLKVLRPDTMGDWDAVVAKLISSVKSWEAA
ncbi:tetratricopeptide repeat protein [Paraburkholderia phenazinium]|jgi:hypothetical protein|uniref:Glycosyltransferase family 9 (Heptosyltransferase) n=1 Tax=Paraburkholderia phenazinium TaxID=60549 RepID=A0A1G8HGU2_9BURK|nr:tetratricopeptide repeat protein [Paraburkholderia phenazinium]SDI05805.1 hypothetical protein SAMN05216466_116143 [Paraburkholderia phenazinium]